MNEAIYSIYQLRGATRTADGRSQTEAWFRAFLERAERLDAFLQADGVSLPGAAELRVVRLGAIVSARVPLEQHRLDRAAIMALRRSTAPVLERTSDTVTSELERIQAERGRSTTQ